MPSAFDTYPKVLNGIESILARDDLKTDIAGWIWLAELQLQRVLRFEATETTLTGQTFVGAQAYVDPPSDFLEGRYFEIQGSPLRYVTAASFDRVTNLRTNVTDGIPRSFAVHGGQIHLGPIPGDGIDYDLYYVSGLTHLSQSNPTGYLLDKGADAVLYTALLNSAPFLGDDDRMDTWGNLAAAAVEALRIVAWNEKLGGGPLRQRPDAYA